MSLKEFIKNHEQKPNKTSITNEELSKLKNFYYDIEMSTAKEISEFFQNIENRKAKSENRKSAIVKVVINTDSHIKQDDVYDSISNTIIIHFPNRNEPEQLYASFVHESNHAYEQYIVDTTMEKISQLSEFDKNIAIMHRIAQNYNIEDENGIVSYQYLYNYNELDSKIAEIKALLECLKLDIESSNLYRQSFVTTINDLKIYNFIDYAKNEFWQIKHYNKYHSHPEKDVYRIMPHIIQTEKDLNINVKDFILKNQKDLSFAKYNELISLRKEIKKLYLIMENYKNNPDSRNRLIKKHFDEKKKGTLKTEIIKEENFEK